MDELELYNEIVRRFTNLFLLADDMVEDDKSGELEFRVECEKHYIATLVKRTQEYGVEIERDAEFGELVTNPSLKEWFSKCQNMQCDEPSFE